ncbi:hypothetical protein F4859DRAFT_315955 [Xylaria cf. heliscus]|nr:hypothetical protein F4859DRAFT_315955 [Xylaria cf. heliscus]
MPPPCSQPRCSRHIGRRSRVSREVPRPRLLTGDSLNDVDEKAEESEENISPDAEKSEVRFTLARRRDRDGNGNGNNGRDNRDDDRPGRNRGGGDKNQDRRNGREDDSDGRGSRFNGGGGGPPVREEDNGGKNGPGDGGDKKGSGDGNGKGDNNGGGRDGNGKGGDDKNGDGKGYKGDGNNGGNGGGDNNGRGGGKDNGNRGGGGGGDRNSSDPSPSDTSSSPPPPPPSSSSLLSSTTTAESTTTEASTTEASTTTSAAESTTIEVITTTSVVTSTPTPAPESTTSSILQTNTIPLLTPVPALAETQPTLTISSVAPDGALETNLSSTSASATDVADSSTPVPTQTNASQANDSSKGNGHHRNKSNDKGGLSPTSERILIAAGSIGAFIVFCFIGWIIYRTLKKSKQSDHQNNSNSWLSKLTPWQGRSAESNAQGQGGFYEPKEPLPAYDFGNNNNSMEAFGYYDQGKFYPLAPEGMTYQPTATLQNGRVVWQTQEVQQPQQPPLQPQASLQKQYLLANDQMIDTGDVNSTLRSRMPDPYYNQSEFARQPSDAYNPAQRQVYRASEISSLSSGFGDGDIIMPPPNIVPKPPEPQVTNNTETNNRPFSWMSRTTTTSERPPRFRSVNSWVDQQKERIRRANSRSRAREEVPAMPGQINFT